jgi:hydroxymethylbilane synthase
VTAERKVSKIFGGSCQIPLAAFATVTGTAMRLRAMVATPDGQRTAQAEVAGSWEHPEFLGEQVSILLEDQDAHAILEACKQEAAQDAAADAVPAPSQGS